MEEYKHIEHQISDYIAANYCSAIEVGIGANPVIARLLSDSGTRIQATDIRVRPASGLEILHDDVYSPDLSLYEGFEVIYSVRPGIEMMPALISLARKADADLLIYHLGCEIYETGGELIDCGVILHIYWRSSGSGQS